MRGRITITILFSFFFTAILSAHPGHDHGSFAIDETVERNWPPRPRTDRSELPWWRGNLHTHSLWSDGDDFPEMIVDWYKRNGYDFLAISDHNVLSLGQRWVNPATNTRMRRGGGMAVYERYRDRFGSWVEGYEVDERFLAWLQTLSEEALPAGGVKVGDTVVRLKPLNEFRTLFEEPGKFLLIQSEEISDRHTVHVNATNLVELIPPQRGETVVETMRNNVDAVLDQRKRTGQPMFPHVNHPNFRWAITAEELAQVEELRFFEVFNGHPSVHNQGDETRPGTEKMWDIILTKRLAELDFGVVYGLGTDDSHQYHTDGGVGTVSPGKAWVMVRAAYLSPEHIVESMEKGDFYASTGVRLRDVRFDGERLSVAIEPDEGASYVTQFIGTRHGYDPSSEPVLGEDGEPVRATRRYSKDIGEVLAEVRGLNPSYTLQGDEIYVRAKVFSSLPMKNPTEEDERQAAWVQPVLPPSGQSFH